ncbi:MAG: GTP cyclohydrolase II [Neisseria sp.]|nr:GTP cyclohydrolase II [Neisseria sp.]
MAPHTPLNRVAVCRLPTEYGEFTMTGYVDAAGKEHIALSVGDISGSEPVLARVHSECLTGDALFSQRCDCGAQLAAAMQAVQAAGRGVIVYLRQEGRGIGLINKIKAYHLQDQGMDTVEANLALGLPADDRNFTWARDIFADLGVERVRLMTNNPQKITILKNCGIDVAERVPLQVGVQAHNKDYLLTKARKMGHLLDETEL